MKYLKLMILLTITIIFGACNKEYTCTCTDDQTGEIINISDYDLSKSDAESACSNADEEMGVSCTLDQK